MPQSGWNYKETIAAGADLSAHQYRVIDISGTLAEEADVAIGVLENKPAAAGEPATVIVLGKAMGIAGEAIAAGARLTVNSGGFLATVTSGDGTCVGKNLSTAVTSGSQFTFIANFISGATTYNQL